MTTQLIDQTKYRGYHNEVVEQCVKLFSGRSWSDETTKMSDESIRKFFSDECSYEEEFVEGTSPAEVAQAQWDACT